MICSILIPSRGRPEGLRKTMASIRAAAPQCQEYEILVRVDFCDQTMKPFHGDRMGSDGMAIGPRHQAWLDHAKFYNDLVSMSSGAWCWIMNDDCIVTGPWLEQLKKAPEKCLIAPEVYGLGSSRYPGCADNGFPMVPMRCWEQFGWKELPFCPDLALYNLLVKDNGWPVHYLKGVTFQHNRASETDLIKHRTL